MKSKRILVTGGFGYVGSCLTPLLLEEGNFVRALDLMLYTDAGLVDLERNPAYNDWKPRFEFMAGDIRDSNTVRAALQEIDTVIHLAAISNDPTGEIDETLTRQVNFDAVGQLLTLAKEEGVKRFINASSSSVFGIKEEANVTEDLEPEPLTFYSRYKALSEWLVLTAASSNFCAVNVRPATICGVSPRQRFDLTVNKLTADAIRKNLITVHGGEQRRPNVGMMDMVHLYSMLARVEAAEINGKTFNFGFENHKVIEIARVIQEELSDLKVRIEITESLDQRDYHISSEKILGTLNYRPVSSIRKEVAKLRQAFANGRFLQIDAPEYYNMQSMKLERHPGCYGLLAR